MFDTKGDSYHSKLYWCTSWEHFQSTKLTIHLKVHSNIYHSNYGLETLVKLCKAQRDQEKIPKFLSRNKRNKEKEKLHTLALIDKIKLQEQKKK